MTDPTPTELETMAKILLLRADDLHAVGTTLSSRADSAVWQCDKADRFRSAIEARQSESHRLAVQLRDLGRYLRILGQQAEQQATQPGT